VDVAGVDDGTVGDEVQHCVHMAILYSQHQGRPEEVTKHGEAYINR